MEKQTTESILNGLENKEFKMYFLKLNEYDLALGSTFFYLLTAFLNSHIY